MNKHYIEVKGVNKARDWLNFYHSDQSQSSPLNNEYKVFFSLKKLIVNKFLMKCKI